MPCCGPSRRSPARYDNGKDARSLFAVNDQPEPPKQPTKADVLVVQSTNQPERSNSTLVSSGTPTTQSTEPEDLDHTAATATLTLEQDETPVLEAAKERQQSMPGGSQTPRRSIISGRCSPSRRSSGLAKRCMSGSMVPPSCPIITATSFEELPQADKEAVQGLTAENHHMFVKALESCFVFPEHWTPGYESDSARVVYDFTPGSSNVWVHAMVHIENASMTEVIAGTNEISEWPTWHPTVTKMAHIVPPEKLVSYFHSHNVIAVFLKSDLIGCLQRFLFNDSNRALSSGEDSRSADLNCATSHRKKKTRWKRKRKWNVGQAGVRRIVVECFTDIDPTDEEHYIKPSGRRTTVEAYTMFIPTSEGVLILQRANFHLPFCVPQWLVNLMMSFVFPSMISNFQKLTRLVQSDKRPYKKFIAADVTGIYTSLQEMADTPAFSDFELQQWHDLSPARPVVAKYVTLLNETEAA
eukprot:GEMP01036863.1.p1 GENE.GEMP01036863.1~~GEMP01036863.1.p1  ORF type:complete len:469 (+),score=52.13 GEMP01036863.1:39-1445(+)